MISNWQGLLRTLLTQPSLFLPTQCYPCCGDGISCKQEWRRTLHRTLLLNDPSSLGISELLYHNLLACGDFKDGDGSRLIIEAEEDYGTLDTALPFTGLPRRPYYKELADRIHHLSSIHIKEHRINNAVTTEAKNIFFLVPAAKLGLSETTAPTLEVLPKMASTKATTKVCQKWLNEASDEGVLNVLGMRLTIGTKKGLFPPSRKMLLEAASVPHHKGKNTKLSVAARARSKHAHRGKERFFGEISGSAESQNKESEAIIIKLLRDAAWINIHVFGAMPYPVLEVRLASGYGARWKADWSDPSRPSNVEFRGFLEPHMANGHEKRWRH